MPRISAEHRFPIDYITPTHTILYTPFILVDAHIPVTPSLYLFYFSFFLPCNFSLSASACDIFVVIYILFRCPNHLRTPFLPFQHISLTSSFLILSSSVSPVIVHKHFISSTYIVFLHLASISRASPPCGTKISQPHSMDLSTHTRWHPKNEALKNSSKLTPMKTN